MTDYETQTNLPIPPDDELLKELRDIFISVGAPYNSTDIERYVKSAATSAEEAIEGTRNAIAELPDATSETIGTLVTAMISPHKTRLEQLFTRYGEIFEQANLTWTDQDLSSQDITKRIAEQFIRANVRYARILSIFSGNGSAYTLVKEVLETNIRLAAFFQVLDQLSYNTNNLTVNYRYEAISEPPETGYPKILAQIKTQKDLRDRIEKQRRGLDQTDDRYESLTLLLVDHLNNIGLYNIDAAVMIDIPGNEGYLSHLDESLEHYTQILDTELKPPIDTSTEEVNRQWVRANSTLGFLYLLLAEQEMRADPASEKVLTNLNLFAKTFAQTATKLHEFKNLVGEFHSEVMRQRVDAILLCAEILHHNPTYISSESFLHALIGATKESGQPTSFTMKRLVESVGKLIGETETEQTDPEDAFYLQRTRARLSRVQSLP